MGQVYSTAQAAKLAGISEGSVRNYVRSPYYVAHFSAGANPPAGQPRELSEADLTLLAYIREQTASGAGHDQIAAQIAAGALVGFTWSPPEAMPEPEEAQPRQAAPEAPQPAALALLAGALNAELVRVRESEQALWERIIAAEKRASSAEASVKAAESRAWAAEAALTAIKREQASRSFWRRLFGV
jgi:hypothetical protein